MKSPPEVCCIVCQLVFCCADCRWNHEQAAHGLKYNCAICRGIQFLCRPEQLNPEFILHLFEEHFPLKCHKCHKYFHKMEDLANVEQCTSISELVNSQNVDNSKLRGLDEKFDSIYDKVSSNRKSDIVDLFGKTSKTAVITPIIIKKALVEYETTESDEETAKDASLPLLTILPKTPKPKLHRVATPHAKKFLQIVRQNALEEDEENVDVDYNSPPVKNKTTPLRAGAEEKNQELTTPTFHVQNNNNMLKLAHIGTTSTPTHPVSGVWSLFPEQSADSPLSEIENNESPAQSIASDPSKCENIVPKLKSIIVSSRLRLGSQDSTEKHVTFQESENNTETSSIKTKKVKFSEDTVFEQENKIKRVFRKPKRMLTPGPQRPKYCFNPRFQALINRFENQGNIAVRTPVQRIDIKEKTLENTPPVGEHSHMLARAINFKEDSPIVESENYSKESNELFKTCNDSPVESDGVNKAISAFTTNIAGSLQSCLSSALRTTEEETEIQFKFIITRKKVNVRIVDDGAKGSERSNETERNVESNKENIWSSVTKAVRNVFWREQGSSLAISTPFKSCNSSGSSSSSSASKRKCQDMTDTAYSPLNHKRQKYEGRINGRPPLRRSKTLGVSSLRSSKSAEQQNLLKEVSMARDDAINLSY
ncbi:hypothetical protein ACJJTC_006352 [Scirpophaga incertulas]